VTFDPGRVGSGRRTLATMLLDEGPQLLTEDDALGLFLDTTFQVLHAGLEPDAGGNWSDLVRITPMFVSGRRIINERVGPLRSGCG
jgi:hypothetical protein